MSTHFRLAEVMLEKGISNKSEFSRETELHRWGLLKLIQQEPTRIEFATIEKLCRALDVLPNDLIEIINDDGTPFTPRKLKKYKAKHRKVSLDKIAGKLSTEKKMAIVKALIK